jgi:hypothetical protein
MDEQCASQNGLSVLPLEICCLISKYVDCNLLSERPDQRRRPSGGREFSRASRASSRAAYEVRTRYVIFLFYLYISFCFMLYFITLFILFCFFHFFLFFPFLFLIIFYVLSSNMILFLFLVMFLAMFYYLFNHVLSYIRRCSNMFFDDVLSCV